MKTIKKIIGLTKRYNMFVIGILVLVFSFLEIILLAFTSIPIHIGASLPVFNVILFCILLEIRLMLRIYTFYRFLRIKLVKMKATAPVK